MTETLDVDERQHATAIKTAVTEALQASGNEWKCLDRDEVPEEGFRATIYVVLDLERRFVDNRRAMATNPTSGWRATLWAVGPSVDEVRWALQRVSDAMDGRSLPIGDRATTPCEFESAERPVFASGEWSAASVWTYITT